MGFLFIEIYHILIIKYNITFASPNITTMTTKDYVKKYQLDKSDKFNHSEFVQDLASDLIVLLEMNKANDNLKGFDNAIRCIRMKFDAIRNKTLGILPDKLWNYFYATVVVKLREEMCPLDMQRRRKLQEERKQEYEKRKRIDEEFNDYFWSRNFYSFLFNTKVSNKPIESFNILGLNENATEDNVKISYRKLANIHHPDKGGKQEKFIEITDAKNKCLEWLNK